MREENRSDFVDFVALGNAPTEEARLRAGSDHFEQVDQCLRYIALLRERMGREPDGADFGVSGFAVPDGGNVYEVVCHYRTNNATAINYAYKAIAHIPAHWDDIHIEAQPTNPMAHHEAAYI